MKMDYVLYPIPLADVSRSVYYMVKTAVWHTLENSTGRRRFDEAFPDSLQDEWRELRNHIGEGHLVFPSTYRDGELDAETRACEAVIIVPHTDGRKYIRVDGVRQPYVPKEAYYNPWTGEEEYDEDEEEPEIEWEYDYHHDIYSIATDPMTGKCRVEKRTGAFPFKIPSTTLCRYDWEAVVRAIDGLLPVVREARLSEGDWAERLEVTRGMLEEHLNELHVLHNGGLYDSHVLRRLLFRSDVELSRWQPLLDEYLSCLKRFAVHVVTLGWKSDPGSSLERYLKGPVSPPDNSWVSPPFPSPKDEGSEYRAEANTSRPSPVGEGNGGEASPTAFQFPSLPDYVPETPSEPDKKTDASGIGREYNRQERDRDILRKEKNAAIRRRVFLYLAVTFVLVFAVMFARYSLTGSLTVSVGVITAIILRNVNRLKEGYEPDADDPAPQWYSLALVLTPIACFLGGIVPFKALMEYVWEVSDGSITPASLWVLLLIVFLLLILYCNIMRLNKKGGRRRVWLFLIVVLIGLTVGMSIGTVSASKKIDQQNWVLKGE